MQIINTSDELRKHLIQYRKASKVIALVPTMGSLHQGHLHLIDRAKTQADIVICSIFVNPLQFAEGEDFTQYPRTLQSDVKKLEQVNCDLIFAPTVDEMYGSSIDGRDQSQVSVPGISDILEGASRPGHFTGVATIVTKLFNMVQPDKAIFGEKDYQQLQLIKRIVADLYFPIDIIAQPIVRENNGLAMSSRNIYLSDEEKQRAAKIYQTLQTIAKKIQQGNREYFSLQSENRHDLNQLGFNTDYIEIRALDLSLPTEKTTQFVILIAAYLAQTRLIDNLQIMIE
jgi:pantoate--beta-alanine ligase